MKAPRSDDWEPATAAASVLRKSRAGAPVLHPAALSPADVELYPTTTPPGAAEGSEMGNPTSSGPLAEGHPDNSFRGLPARPAALY